MSFESVLVLIFGVPVAIYTGFVLIRYQRFSELKSKVLHAIQEIEYVEESGKVRLLKRRDASELVLLSSELYAMKQVRAGERLGELAADINTTLMLAGNGAVDSVALEAKLGDWLSRARGLSPNEFKLFWRRLDLP